jgi:peptide/nickel transport system substrate-binding protein
MLIRRRKASFQKSAAAFCAIVVIAGAAGMLSIRRRASAPATTSPTVSGTLVTSVRAEPRSFNRYLSRDLTTSVITYLLHSGLVRVNRVTDQLEPELAESWQLLDDGRTYRLQLRRDVTFSDGTPFTARDVLFSFAAIYDQKTDSVLADSLQVAGARLTVAAQDDHTVDVCFPSPFGPGLRLLDGVPMLPRHKLERALAAGQFRSEWGVSTAPSELVGLGPFVLREYQPGQRLIFEPNEHYWRRQGTERLPRANRLVLEVLRDQDSEALALQTGSLDFTQSELRPMDIAAVSRATRDGRLSLADLGISSDGDLFWINQGAARATDPRSQWMQHADFRRAVAHAIDREQFVKTVFLGAAVPGYGAVSPGNRQWYVDAAGPRPDPDAARRLLSSLDLVERGGVLVDAHGAPVRFTLMTQRGNTSLERGAAAIRESLGKLGIQVEIAALEAGALVKTIMAGDYDAAYFRLLTTDTDPALNADFWRSGGSAHIWNPAQPKPATDWEARIDALMTVVSTSLDRQRRWQAFAEVQGIMAREVPAICFAFPRLSFAMNARISGGTPAPFRPPLLWNPAVIGVNAR